MPQLDPIPTEGPERVAWWAELYERLANDADQQRKILASYDPADPDHAEGWFEAYRERLHDLVDHAIDRTEWTP